MFGDLVRLKRSLGYLLLVSELIISCILRLEPSLLKPTEEISLVSESGWLSWVDCFANEWGRVLSVSGNTEFGQWGGV